MNRRQGWLWLVVLMVTSLPACSKQEPRLPAAALLGGWDAELVPTATAMGEVAAGESQRGGELLSAAIASRFHRSPTAEPQLPVQVVFGVNGLATVEVDDAARKFLEASIWEVLPTEGDQLLIRFSQRGEKPSVLPELFPEAVKVEFRDKDWVRLADTSSPIAVDLRRR